MTHKAKEGVNKQKGGEQIPSGAIQAGAYMRPGHWKENFASAMLILAVMSSSICKPNCISFMLTERAALGLFN